VGKQIANSAAPVLPTTSPLATACAWGYFVLLITCIAIFYLGGSAAVVAGQEMSLPKLVFTILNFGTLTGFPTTTNYTTDLKIPGQILALLLTLGGTLYSLIVGGTAAVRILKLPYSDKQVCLFSVVLTVLATIAGSVFLVRGDQTFLASIFQAASAFGNSGAWIGVEPALDEWQTWLVLLPLALLGGFGLPVLIEMLWPRKGRKLSQHSHLTLSLNAMVIVIGAGLLLALNWPDKMLGMGSMRTPFLQAVSGTIQTRSAGLPLYFITPEFSRAAHRILMLLMLIGAGTAGTAGGLKLTTMYVLYRGTRDSLSGRSPGRIFGVAMTWLVILLGIILLCHINLLRQVPDLDADRLLMLSVSAATNCGLAHDKVSLAQSGYNSLSITMLLGRIVPPMMLWWLAQTTRDADVCVG